MGGPGVASGYLGNPAATAASFLPDPLAPEPGWRMYRAGDRARLTAGGVLLFRGRADLKVKVRGHRLDLAELESAIAGLGTLGDCAVQFDRDRQSLVAFCTRSAAAVWPADLRARVARLLPEHMVPVEFIVLPYLPGTAHGKLDRRALAPVRSGPPESTSAPGGTFLDVVRDMFAAALRTPRAE